MKFNIIEAFKGAYHKSVWFAQKNAPEICLIMGITTAIGAVVASSVATVKATPIIEEHNRQMAVIHQNADAGKTGDGKEYTYADQKRDTIIVFTKTGIRLLPVFGLTIGLLSGSIIAQICGYKVMAERLALAAAAYSALKNKYDKLSAALDKELGPQKRREIENGTKAVEIEDNGEKKNIKMVEVADDDAYTLVFGKYNRDGSRNLAWQDGDMEANITWLKMEQSYWNNMLKARRGRPVSVNEIRARCCGETECVESGQVLGWVYEPDNPNHVGDNYIDFGLDTLFTAFRNGEEIPDDQCIVLNFNCDGNILYAYGKRKLVA